MVDHQIDELDLIRSGSLAKKKTIKRSFCRLTIQSYEGAQEKPKSKALWLGTIQILSSSSAGIEEHLFQLLNVSPCQWLIESELMDGGVILVGLQELANLCAKFLEVRPNAEPRQLYRGLIPQRVL